MNKNSDGVGLALYRKYRPQKWNEVLGQEHIIDVLEGAIKNDNISHAYLLYGARGTGKTTVARIFADSIGVSNNDIYEMDAASNRGIDDIRELREGVVTLPLESPYKVYIIDEVHMLTKEAFNALLKTLEEPPKHVIFILATTELQKLPETVVSRCQTFTFKKPSHEILKSLVLNTAKKEGKKLDTASADLIALLGDGSFRDTLGTLQKAISFSSEKEISAEKIEKIVGAPSSELINNVLLAISENGLSKGLSSINIAVGENIEMKIFAKLILRKLRAVLLLRFAKDMKAEILNDFSKEEVEFLESIAKNAKNINSAVLQEFLTAYSQIGYSHIPQLPLELALVKLIGNKEKE